MRFWVVNLLFLLSMTLDASWVSLKDKGEVFLPFPASFKHQFDMFEVPLIVVGPKEKRNGDQGRFTLSVVPTEVENLKLDAKGLEKKYFKYKEGRKKWLSKLNGKVNYFFPFKHEKWAKNIEAFKAGYEYTLNNVIYVEDSFYVNCSNRLYVLKALYRKNVFDNEREKYQKIIKEFDCRL